MLIALDEVEQKLRYDADYAAEQVVRMLESIIPT